MARRKTKLSIDEKIIDIKSQIEEKQNEIKSLKEQLKALESEKEKADLEALYAVLKESGKTVDDVRNMLTQQ